MSCKQAFRQLRAAEWAANPERLVEVRRVIDVYGEPPACTMRVLFLDLSAPPDYRVYSMLRPSTVYDRLLWEIGQPPGLWLGYLIRGAVS